MRADFAGLYDAGRFRRLHGCSAKTSPGQAGATRAAPSMLLARPRAAPWLLSLSWRRRSSSGTRPSACALGRAPTRSPPGDHPPLAPALRVRPATFRSWDLLGVTEL